MQNEATTLTARPKANGESCRMESGMSETKGEYQKCMNRPE